VRTIVHQECHLLRLVSPLISRFWPDGRNVSTKLAYADARYRVAQGCGVPQAGAVQPPEAGHALTAVRKPRWAVSVDAIGLGTRWRPGHTGCTRDCRKSKICQDLDRCH